MNGTRRTYLILAAKGAVLVAAAAAGVGIGLMIRGRLHPAPPGKPAAQQPAAHAVPTPTPLPTPRGLRNDEYGLTIPAQRAKDYPGAHLAVEQAPRDGDGYRVGLISYESDGLKEYAQVTLPAGPQPAGGYPVVVLVHGYVPPDSYTSDEPFYSSWAQAFARQGYMVVKPDLRGHGLSWGVPEGAYYSAGYVSDVLNLTSALGDYPAADTRRIAVLGHSMGGHVALSAALVRPEWFRAVVLASSATGPQAEMYQQWHANSDFGNPLTYGLRQRVITLFGEPGPDSAFWQAADPYRFLRDLRSPVAVLQAQDDDTVPYRFATELERALSEAGRTVELKPYATGGHSFGGETRAQAVTDAVDFLNREDR
jgi:dipeptidyl aminopeptidase/acylaminoacyl peptidase